MCWLQGCKTTVRAPPGRVGRRRGIGPLSPPRLLRFALTRAEAVFDAADVGDNTFVDGLIHYSVVVAGWVQDPIRTLACSAPISHVSLRRTVLENRLARMTMKITGYSGIYRDIPGYTGISWDGRDNDNIPPWSRRGRKFTRGCSTTSAAASIAKPATVLAS